MKCRPVKLPASAVLGGEDGDLIPRGLWEHSRAWSEEMAGGTQRPLALRTRGGLVKDVGMVDSGFLSTSIMRHTGILDEGGVRFSLRLESGLSVGFAFCSSDCFIMVCYFRFVC